MKKYLNIFLVTRKEVENKWWHRLVQVLIYCSAILVAIFVTIIFLSNTEKWKKYSYTAFDFENNYSTAEGTDVTCFIKSNPTNVSCGEYTNKDGSWESKFKVNMSDFAERHYKAVKNKIGQGVIDKICADSKEQSETISQKMKNELDLTCLLFTYGTPGYSLLTIDDFPGTYIEQGYYRNKYLSGEQIGFLNSQIMTDAKMITVVDYPVLLKNLFYIILAILGWFIFWESIVYRTILYIIFGKKK